MRLTLLFAVLLLIPGVAKAQYSGMDLSKECKTADSMFSQHRSDTTDMAQLAVAQHCMGVIHGVVRTLQYWSNADSDARQTGTPRACIPKDATLGQNVKVFLKYADNHPEQLHMDAVGIVIYAMLEAFPCKT